MKHLTDNEISEWYSENGMSVDPYSENDDSRLYVQFYQPEDYKKKEAFSRSVLELTKGTGTSLFHVKDWDHYTESQMIAIDAIRAQDGEKRKLIEAPGRILSEGEEEIGALLLSLTSSFGWTSYLHCPGRKVSLLNWEGEIYDFWTESSETMSKMSDLIDRFNLKKTNEQNQALQATSASARRLS